MSTVVYRAISVLLTGTGALGCLTFVVAYWIRSRGSWWHSEPGRFMMLTYATVGSLLLLVFSNLTFGEWPGRRLVTVILFAAYCAFAWWPLRLLHVTRTYVETDSEKDHD